MKFDNNNCVYFYGKRTDAPFYAIYPAKNDAGGSVFSPITLDELHQWLDHDEGRRLIAYPRKSNTQRTIYNDCYDVYDKVCNVTDARTGELLAIVKITNALTMEYEIAYITSVKPDIVRKHIKRSHYWWY